MKPNQKSIAILTAVISCLLVASFCPGQEKDPPSKDRIGMGYFMFGLGQLDLKLLNTKLIINGYPELSDNFISFGGGGHTVIKRILLGGEGHGLIGDGVVSENYETSLSAGYGFFNLGFILHSTKAFRIYPVIGIGGGGISLRITETGKAPSFNDVLVDPKRGSEISTWGFLLNLALGFDYLVILEENEEGSGGLLFGLRAGWTFTPVKGDWMLYDSKISAGPKLGITGPYIRLMIGGGGHGMK